VDDFARAYAVLKAFAVKSYSLAIQDIDGGLMVFVQVSFGSPAGRDGKKVHTYTF
jgi:hypothetical protein